MGQKQSSEHDPGIITVNPSPQKQPRGFGLSSGNSSDARQSKANTGVHSSIASLSGDGIGEEQVLAGLDTQGKLFEPILREAVVASTGALQPSLPLHKIQAQPFYAITRSIALHEHDCAATVLENQLQLKRNIKETEANFTAAVLRSSKRSQDAARSSERFQQFVHIQHDFTIAVENLQYLVNELEKLNALLPDDARVAMPDSLAAFSEKYTR